MYHANLSWGPPRHVRWCRLAASMEQFIRCMSAGPDTFLDVASNEQNDLFDVGAALIPIIPDKSEGWPTPATSSCLGSQLGQWNRILVKQTRPYHYPLRTWLTNDGFIITNGQHAKVHFKARSDRFFHSLLGDLDGIPLVIHWRVRRRRYWGLKNMLSWVIFS